MSTGNPSSSISAASSTILPLYAAAFLFAAALASRFASVMFVAKFHDALVAAVSSLEYSRS